MGHKLLFKDGQNLAKKRGGETHTHTRQIRVVQKHGIDQPGEKRKSQYNYDKWEPYFAKSKIVNFISKKNEKFFTVSIKSSDKTQKQRS